MTTTTAEITWISTLLQDIGVVILQPPHLFYENIYTLHMTINPIIHGRTKCIKIDYHFVQEKVAIDQLITHFILSSLQIVYLLTKPLVGELFWQFRKKKLGVHFLPLPSLKGHEDRQIQNVDDQDSDNNIHANTASNTSLNQQII